MTLCYIGLGSNLQNPAEQVKSAMRDLGNLPQCEVLATSSLYLSAPVGPQDQPDFINAVVALTTTLLPLALLDALQALELAAGRQRLRQWGERTLDMDILLYGAQVIDLPRLKIPHPEMTHRAFVLQPLAELAPTLVLPDGRPLAALLPAVSNQMLKRLT